MLYRHLRPDVTVTLPPPVPDARSRVSQATAEDVVHAQDDAGAAVTVTDLIPAWPSQTGRTANCNVHGGGGGGGGGGGAASAACDTVTVRPAIVSVPDRGDVVVLASEVNATVPSPAPDAPAVM